MASTTSAGAAATVELREQHTAQKQGTPERHDRLLAWAGWVFAAGSTIHVVDHLRRGQGSISDALYWLGNAGLVLQVVVITLVLTRHRLAAQVSLPAGLLLASGFAAVHWLPHWSVLSDPVWEIDSARWLSYVASLSEIVGALVVAVGAAAVLSHRARAAAIRAM